MIDEALAKLIEFIESASPVVWQAAQQQVRADIMETRIWVYVIGAIFLMLLALSIFTTARAARDRYGDWDVGAGFSWFFTACAVLIFGGTLAHLVKMADNPVWYAILKLRELVP